MYAAIESFGRWNICAGKVKVTVLIMRRLCGHLSFFEASFIHKMMCFYTTSDAHADQGKELYL